MFVLSQSIKTNKTRHTLVLTEVVGDSMRTITSEVNRQKIDEFCLISLENGAISAAYLFGAARTGEIRLSMIAGHKHAKMYKKLFFKYVGVGAGEHDDLPQQADGLQPALEWAQWACRADTIDRVDVYAGTVRIASAVHHRHGDADAVTVALF